MLVAVWPLIVCVAGILLWTLTSNAKLTEIGRWMFVIGLFWLVYSLTGKTLRLG